MYPPESHALRDLPFEIEAISREHYRAHVDLDRGLAPDGVVSVGAIATVADVVSGALCGGAIAPDWMATSALSLHLGDLPRSGMMHVEARTARLGRSALVIQLTLLAAGTSSAEPSSTGTGAAAGEGLAAFTRLPRRDTNLDIASSGPAVGERTSMALANSGLVDTFESALGCVVTNAASGATLTPVVPYVQNSFGAVNGGIVAALADISARSVVDARLPPAAAQAGSRTTDVSVQYLSQVRSGSVRTTAQIVRATGDSVMVRVELSDATGTAAAVADDSWSTLMAVAHVDVSTWG